MSIKREEQRHSFHLVKRTKLNLEISHDYRIRLIKNWCKYQECESHIPLDR